MYGHASPQPIVTTISACSASSRVSFCGLRSLRSTPSSAIASMTSGWTRCAGVVPAEAAVCFPSAACSNSAWLICERPALCRQTNRTWLMLGGAPRPQRRSGRARHRRARPPHTSFAASRGCRSRRCVQPSGDLLERIGNDVVVSPKPPTFAAEHAGSGQDLEVLGERLLAHLKQRCELALTDRPRRGRSQRVDDAQARGVSKSLGERRQLDRFVRAQVRLRRDQATASWLPLARRADRSWGCRHFSTIHNHMVVVQIVNLGGGAVPASCPER